MQWLIVVCRMRNSNIKFFLAMVMIVAAPSAIRAEVLDAEVNGFTVRHLVTIAADRQKVYHAAVSNIGDWWNGEHTVSGYAANLYLTDSISGCFCERLGEGAGLVHMSVSFVNPGVMLRLTGGLGPLGLMGVSGNMTWEFEDADGDTIVTLQYAVGGYMPGGLDTAADAVDGVLVEQLTRLKSFVETGDPTEG
jgi:uncharacterized protein YndB with AHSA1/START domain